MHRDNYFNKASVVKTAFVLMVTFGLTFWLDRPNVWDTIKKSCLTFAIAQVNPNVKGDNNPNALLAGLAAPEMESKALTPYVTENKTINLPDFTHTARIATPAVVHVRARQSASAAKRYMTNPLDQLFREFFGEGFGINPKEYTPPEQFTTGSGVIYTNNGYIITNNHVIEGADRIEVTLHDNRFYEAKLIGADPNTDLAILKINETNLPFLKIGNSDRLEVGEWVLAVGNPFNLNSTVTKGIVSAKARQLGGNNGDGKLSIQSFIQTDAAINQGNSGGALVNLYAELVGINTVIIASSSSGFMGYGFAIPASLVKKVAYDLMQYGMVQRVLLGVIIREVNAELAKKLGLNRVSGVYIDSVQPDSPCAKLIQKEDVITQINERKIDKTADLQEVIGCAKPGDKITITLYRKGKEKKVSVVLEKASDPVQLVQKNNLLQTEGATFQNMDAKTKATLKLSSGVLVKEVTKGKFQSAGLKKGYILLAFDKQPVDSIKALAEMLRNTKGAALLKVMEPNRRLITHLAVEFSHQSPDGNGQK